MDLNSVLNAIASYLPPPLSSALLSVSAALPSSLSLPSSVSSLLPILLSLTTLYFTLLSLYSTTRFALRLAWWSLKWGTLAAAVATAYSGWSSGGANGTGGWAEGARNLATAGSGVYGVGRRGVEWWAQNGGWGANDDAPGTGRGPARRTGKGRRGTSGSRSASGAPRTWAAASDDGGWDTPGDEADPDPIKYIQKSLLTFLNSPPPPAATPEKKLRKGKKSAETPAPAIDFGAMAMDFAMGKARKAWDDLSQGFLGGERTQEQPLGGARR